MKIFCTCFSLLLFSAFSYAEKCKLDHLKDLDYSDIECQFYMGTTAYRNGIYTVAAAHWQHVVDSPVKYEGDEHIKAMSLSTLTYLTYNGLGIDRNRSKAVELWKEAVKKGDIEARKHLGNAFSDKAYKGFDLIEALGWYESVFIVLKNPENAGEDVKEIYNDAKNEALGIRKTITDSELTKALEFAKSTL